MAHAQIQTETRQYRRQDARRKMLLGGAVLAGVRTGKFSPDILTTAIEMIPDKDRALFADGEPNAETLAAMEDPGKRFDTVQALMDDLNADD